MLFQVINLILIYFTLSVLMFALYSVNLGRERGVDFMFFKASLFRGQNHKRGWIFCFFDTENTFLPLLVSQGQARNLRNIFIRSILYCVMLILITKKQETVVAILFHKKLMMMNFYNTQYFFQKKLNCLYFFFFVSCFFVISSLYRVFAHTCPRSTRYFT